MNNGANHSSTHIFEMPIFIICIVLCLVLCCCFLSFFLLILWWYKTNFLHEYSMVVGLDLLRSSGCELKRLVSGTMIRDTLIRVLRSL